MSFFGNQLMRIQLASYLFSSTVLGNAVFTNPPGPVNSTTLTIGDTFIIEWSGSGAANEDYSELSLGIAAPNVQNIFWLLSNVEGYTAQNYQYTVGLGNGITADDGPFLFILVNGTEFGEQVLSPEFAIKQASTTLSSSSSTSTPSSSATSSNTATTTSAKPSSSSSAASSSSSGLSTGAQAGIGVGVALGVLALLGVAFLAWRHRRRNAAASKLQEAPDNQFRGRNTNSQYAGLSPNTQYKETPQYSPRGYTSYEDMQKPGTPAGYAEAPNSEMAQIHEAPTHTPVHEAP